MVLTTHLWLKIVMPQLEQVMGQAQPVVVGSEGGGWNFVVQWRQKSLRWMKDLLAKVRNLGKLAVYQCAAMLSETKQCMVFPKYGLFVGCETDAVFFNSSLLSFVETFVRQVLK